MTILVTGGAGYIGSHTLVALSAEGYRVVVVDNCSNSHPSAVERVKKLTGGPIPFYQGDVRDAKWMGDLLVRHQVSAVIHFAGAKAVGESVGKPLEYYENNLGATISLIRAMADVGCRQLVFSSSATVYGAPTIFPIPESSELRPSSPYGNTKAFAERILTDLAASDVRWSIAILRYFNPVGAHRSGLLGENPRGVPNNLFPYIARVAAGILPRVNVFGSDYNTPDGTGVRDYIHVCDLADGHVAALQYLQKTRGAAQFNLGTGRGYSVFEAIRMFEIVSGKPVPYVIAPRRPGDVAISLADPSLAREKLKWSAVRGLREMCDDHWRWQLQSNECSA